MSVLFLHFSVRANAVSKYILLSALQRFALQRLVGLLLQNNTIFKYITSLVHQLGYVSKVMEAFLEICTEGFTATLADK